MTFSAKMPGKGKWTKESQPEDYLWRITCLAARGLPFKEELEKVLDFYGSDFDPDLLETQLISFSALFSDSKNITFSSLKF